MKSKPKYTYKCTVQVKDPTGATWAEVEEWESHDPKEIWDMIDSQLRAAGTESAWPEELVLPDGTVLDHHAIVKEHWDHHWNGYKRVKS